MESNYSFTEKEDLEWMDMPYERPEDFAVLRDYFTEYCTKRFDKLKRLFCDSLGIPFVSSDEIEVEKPVEVIIPARPEKKYTTVKFADKCIQRLAESVGEDLIKLSLRCRQK